MKKKLIFFCMLLFTGYILLFPKESVEAAREGLLLWYSRVLPTLLPFTILSNILIRSGYLQYANRIFAPVIKKLFPVSDNGAFVLLSGFLFGFPMGSKNCAELLKSDSISKKEADVLFVITNNISPVFISSYILCQQLEMPSLTLISYVVLYLPPLAAGAILLPRVNQWTQTQKKPASGSQMNFKIIDAGIMNSFETLTRLGGYIMLFSMNAAMLSLLPLSDIAKLTVTGITEITNGIQMLSDTSLSLKYRYLFAMGFTAFGGLSGIAQTSSMVKDTGLSLRAYCTLKVILTACSVALAWGVTVWFRIS